jgi:ubiquitin fusion degradation protein 1
VVVFAEARAEEEPKFIPFTGSGRRLDGKASKDKDVLASSQAKRQANAANSVQPSTATTSQGSSSRKTTGKLVFGSGGSRADKVGILQHIHLVTTVWQLQ